jgi:hypothetical protein
MSSKTLPGQRQTTFKVTPFKVQRFARASGFEHCKILSRDLGSATGHAQSGS